MATRYQQMTSLKADNHLVFVLGQNGEAFHQTKSIMTVIANGASFPDPG